MTMQITFISKIFLTVFVLLSCACPCAASDIACLTANSECFHANITFVLLQIFFMAFDHMCLQIVRSAKSLGTYLTCDYTA